MRYEVNFGTVTGTLPAATAAATGKFRLAILGDFSGHANRGRLETGEQLAQRKPLRVDVDNLDDVLARLGVRLRLPIGDGGGVVEVPIASLEDFHPDQLYDRLEVFAKLASLRERLRNPATFAAAAKALQSMVGQAAIDRHAPPPKARSTSIPNQKLSDFARLIGQPTTAEPNAPVTELIKQIVRAHVVQGPDPQQAPMLAAIDESLSAAMRRVLHHPDFQTLESLWRSVELLVRRLESDSTLQIVLLDISAEEIAADLSHPVLDETGLFKLLVEQPSLDEQQGAYTAIVGNYVFEPTPPHADLLGRLAKIAASAKAPFLAAIGQESLKIVRPDEVHPLVRESWSALRALPESVFLGLTVPRFMLRWPYGKKTEPIERFRFEEFTRQTGVAGMLWGNGAFLAGLLLGETFRQQGLKAMRLGSVLSVGDLPYYYYTDSDGDQIALPCTDRLLSEKLAGHVRAQGFMPLLSLKGRAEVRLGGLLGLTGQPLAGRWCDPSSLPAPTPGTAAPVKGFAAPAPAPAPSAVAASADAELDALLADLGGAPAAPAAPAAAAPNADAELDALLAGLGGGDAPAASDPNAMDPGLAALLADL